MISSDIYYLDKSVLTVRSVTPLFLCDDHILKPTNVLFISLVSQE